MSISKREIKNERRSEANRVVYISRRSVSLKGDRERCQMHSRGRKRPRERNFKKYGYCHQEFTRRKFISWLVSFYSSLFRSRNGGILINESCSEKWRDFNLDPFPLLSYTVFFSRLSILS